MAAVELARLAMHPVDLPDSSHYRHPTTIMPDRTRPEMSPFSVTGKGDGDIRNLGAGQVWDRTGPNTGLGVQVSPKTLGGHDINSYFAALKYQPNDWFQTTYKFDYAADDFTPDAEAVTAISPTTAFLFAPAGVAPNYVLDPSGKRPYAVNNAFTTPGYEKTYGHNLTSTLQVNDAFSLKNVLAYRYSFISSAPQLDGLGGLTLPSGTPIDAIVIRCSSRNGR